MASITKILLVGVNGAMGHLLRETFTAAPEFEVAAGIDLAPDARENPFPVFPSLAECTVEADLLVDFSKPGALDANLNYARSRHMPMIIATTGYSAAQRESIAAAAREIPIFFAANMSLGVNLQLQLCQQAAKFFGDQADIEILEKHHNRKVDAPSGTALLLADGMNDAMGGIYHYQCGRAGGDCKRKPREIGIQAIRGGNIAGDHEVYFITNEEILTIAHHSENRRVFAAGALRAARFLAGKPAGLYSMQDVLAQKEAAKKAKVESDVAILTVKNASCTISYLARLMAALSQAGIEANLLNQSAASQGRIDFSFALQSGNLLEAEKCIQQSAPGIDYMIQRGLTKYTVCGPDAVLSGKKCTALLEKLAARYIDILMLCMLDNKLVFFTEAEYQSEVAAFLDQCF